MAKPAPNPVEVQDFQFKLHCRFKIFANEENAPFENPCTLVATASRFGLIFVGTATPAFQVIQIKTIEQHAVREGGVTDYNRRTIPVPSPPKHLAVNCDCSKLAVVVERNQCPIGLIYDITSMFQQEVSAPAEIRLSPTPGVNVLETSWNPTVSNIFTACKSDGTLGLYELNETGISINELPAEAQATCMCWSPKGKQIAVGSFNGKITQYKPDLKAMKVVNGPPLPGFPSVVALQWIANYQFIAVYKPHNAESSASLVIDAPKTGETVYTNYEDICYSNGNLRPPQFYMIFQPNWNILMVASSNSMEVGVLGSEMDKWIQWTMADAARAELPLSASKQETMPIGLAIDTSTTEPFLWGETTIPPAPFLLVLSNDGVLCCFRIINMKPGVTPICQAPACFADTSGLSQFTNPGPQNVPAKISVAEPPKQPILPTPPPKQPEVPQQPAFSFTQPLPTPAPTLPQVPLFATPPTSLFENQFQPPISELTPPKSDTGSLFGPKPTAQNLFGPPVAQPVITVPAAPTSVKIAPTAPVVSYATTATNLVTPSVATPVLTIGTSSPVSTPVASLTPITSPALPSQPAETSLGQEELDFLIGEVIRDECEMLETELKAILHKGRMLKVDLGSDNEAVELVHGADTLEDFLKEVTETSAGQDAEVHHLKQGLIQTWAWYEDARSRFVQTQDPTLETLKRIQQLDPVSQRYQANIQHMVYYLESQLVQANRVLDEQWENFQDSCKKIVKLKIPTMEAVYQTMVRQSATHQKQVYILKDISSRVRAQRSRVSQPSVLVSLNSADQLERELRRLQLEPQHFLQAQYDRVVQNQQRFTTTKMQKLSKLLMEKDNVNVTPSRPKLSNKLHTSLQSSLALKKAVEPSLLGSGLSPIATRKQLEPRVVDFIQSTPKPGTIMLDPKQISVSLVTPVSVPAKPVIAPTSLPTNSAIKFILNTGNSAASVLPVTTTTTAAPKPETSTTATSTPQFKFTAIPSTSMFSLGTTTLVTSATNATQPSFSVSITKITSTPTPFTMVPISQAKSSGETITTKPSASFGSLFGSPKPAASTFSFSLTTTTAASTTTAQPANTKLLTSTANSAFVPTTQLAFNFSAKSSAGTSVANSAVSTGGPAKLPTFIFGTSTAVAPTISASSVVVTTSTTVPTSTTPIAVASTATSVITVPIFSMVKTSSFDSVSVAASVTSPALAKSNTETTTSILQGIVAPKPVSSVVAQESAAVIEPSVGDVVSSTDKKEVTSTAAVPNQQGLLFGMGSTATQQSSLLNLVKSSSASQLEPATVISAVTTTQPEKVNESQSIFGKVPLPTNSVFGAATPTTTTESIFGTTTGSIFGSGVATTTGPLLGTTAPPVATTTSLVFGAGTASIFGSSTTAPTGSLFSTTTTTPTSGSLFGALPATSPLLFGAVGTQPGSVLGTPQTASTVAATMPITAFTTTTTTTTTDLGTSAATPTSPTFVTPTTMSSSIFGSIGTTSTGSIFGSSPATDSTFGGAAAAAPSTTSSSIFGSVATTTPSGSLFGATATTTGSLFGAVPVTSSSMFGSPTFAPAATSAGSIFAQTPSTTPSVFGGAAATSTVFGGAPKSTTSSIFGSAPFASANTGGGGSPFGGTTTTPATVFGQPAAVGGGSIFGTPVSSPTNTFGSATPGTFGSGGSVFGGSNTAPSNFSQAPTSPFSFAAAAANVPSTNSAFGFSEQPAFGFGAAAPASTDPSSFGFGNLNVAPTATASSGFGSSFGQSSNSNPFAKIAAQQQKADFGSTSLLGTPATTASSSSIFGGGSPSSFGSSFGAPAFGSPSFGQQPAFGQGAFGSSFGSSAQPGPFSGGNQSVAQTGFGGFGQPQKPSGFGAAPVFGGSPPAFGTAPPFGGGTSAFGASPAFGGASKVFGGPAPATVGTFGAPPQQENSTFANLATQNTLGFGSLAQQTPSNSPMSSSFSGGGSFSTWR